MFSEIGFPPQQVPFLIFMKCYTSHLLSLLIMIHNFEDLASKVNVFSPKSTVKYLQIKNMDYTICYPTILS